MTTAREPRERGASLAAGRGRFCGIGAMPACSRRTTAVRSRRHSRFPRANHVSWRAGRGVASQHERTCRPGWRLAACVLQTDRGRSVQPSVWMLRVPLVRDCGTVVNHSGGVRLRVLGGLPTLGPVRRPDLERLCCVRSRDQTAGRWLQSDDAAVYGDPRAGLRGRRGGDRVVVRQVRLRGSLAGRRSSCAALAKRRYGGDY